MSTISGASCVFITVALENRKEERRSKRRKEKEEKKKREEEEDEKEGGYNCIRAVLKNESCSVASEI